MPSDFQFKEPPLALGVPKGRPWYGMDIFWNRPIHLQLYFNIDMVSICELRKGNVFLREVLIVEG